MMNLEFKNINNLSLEELFQELGLSVYVASKTSEYLEQVQTYQQQLYLKIGENIPPNEQELRRTNDGENLPSC